MPIKTSKKRKPSATTRERPNLRHYLGGIIGGRLYFFTGLGEHKTARAARDRWFEAPRNGHAVIVCNWDAVRHGCVCGTHEELLSIDDLLPLERSPCPAAPLSPIAPSNQPSERGPASC